MLNSLNFRLLQELTPDLQSNVLRLWQRMIAIMEGECSHEAKAALRKLFRAIEVQLDRSASYSGGTRLSRSALEDFFDQLLASVPHDRAVQFCLPEFLARDQHYDFESWSQQQMRVEDGRLFIGGYMVMADWQIPLMRRCVDLILHEVRAKKPRVLELGWGLGISGNLLLESGLESYTVVEAHAEVAEQARLELKRRQNTQVLHAFWQDVHFPENSFDIIFFDTYQTTYSGSSLFDDLLVRFYASLTQGGVFFPFFGGPQSLELITAFTGSFPFQRIVLSLISGIKASPDWWNVEDGYLARVFIK